MFTKSAAYYDALYSWKDYEAESGKLHDLIQSQMQGEVITLLDVGCGTGAHHPYLKMHYQIEGLDLDEEMLKVARERQPDIPYHHGDMTNFDLGKPFDVIVCLFSSIGYVKTVDALNQTLMVFARHVKPGGLVIVEPWFGPEEMRHGLVSAKHVETDEFKITRMNQTKIDGRLSILNFHYLLGTADGITYFTEKHEMGLFTVDEYTQAFIDAGFDVTHDPVGLMDRGLYIGVYRDSAGS